MPEIDTKEYLRPWSPAIYRIEVEGRLEGKWSSMFAGLNITHRIRADQSVITRFTGFVQDQYELVGVLNGLAEMHLPILRVEKLDQK
jgi:hypothetical protein